MSNEDRHAAVQILKTEICRAFRARWAALEILHDNDEDRIAATLVISLLEVMLEIIATGCDSEKELRSRQAMLGSLMAGYAHGPGELRDLWQRARRMAGVKE